MGKKYKNNIEITSGFSYTAESPIDDRLVQSLFGDLLLMVTNKNSYDEMIVGVVSKGTYRYNKANNKWIRLANTKNITRNGVSIEVLDETLDDNSVDTINIKSSAVTTPKLADNAVTAAKLGDSSVETAKVKDKAITENKLSDDLNSILIKGSFGTAAMQEGSSLETGKIYIQYDV